MTTGGTYPVMTSNRWKYNGKEVQTTGNVNWLDYGAREYDEVIARWTRPDPMSEKYYGTSGYTYCVDNPIRFIDPIGRNTIELNTDFYNHTGKKIGTDGVNNGVKVLVTNNREARKVSRIKGNVDINSVKSRFILPHDVVLKECINVLDRTIANGGLREESSIIMNNGSVIQGQTGSMPIIENGEQTANASLPNLPKESTSSDVEATIHSHPTTVQEYEGKVYPQSASRPSPTDKNTFKQFNTNIIVGPLETINNGTRNNNGFINIPDRTNGVVFYDRNTTPHANLSIESIWRILNN